MYGPLSHRLSRISANYMYSCASVSKLDQWVNEKDFYSIAYVFSLGLCQIGSIVFD